GKNGGDARAIEIADFFVGAPADELDAVTSEALEVGALRPVANHRESEARLARGHHRQIHAFVRYERGHHQKLGLWLDRHSRPGRVELSVDRRIHKGRLTIIVKRDPPRNILRDSEIAVYSAFRGAVPPRQSREHRSQQRVAKFTDAIRSEIRVELIPGVAHRGQAITEVARPPGHDDRFGRAVAGADDEVVAVEVELLDGDREERKVLAIEAA